MDANFLIGYNKVLKILMFISLFIFLIVLVNVPYDSCRMCSIEYNGTNHTGVEIRNIWNEECGKLYMPDNMFNLLPTFDLSN